MTRQYVRHMAPRDVVVTCAVCGRTAIVAVSNGHPPRYCTRCRPGTPAYREWMRRRRRDTRVFSCRGCGVPLPDPGHGQRRTVWHSEACRGQYRRDHGGGTQEDDE